MITVSVRLGRVKIIGANGDNSITLQSLRAEGYDSVQIPRPGGTEYIVYDQAQCDVLKVEQTGRGAQVQVPRATKCRHGTSCYRTNRQHILTEHPPGWQPRPKPHA